MRLDVDLGLCGDGEALLGALIGITEGGNARTPGVIPGLDPRLLTLLPVTCGLIDLGVDCDCPVVRLEEPGVPGGVTPFPFALLSPITFTNSFTDTPCNSGGMSLLIICAANAAGDGGSIFRPC